MAEHLASIFGTEKDRVNCPFYFKIGACRHGDRCSRLHNKPTISQTILVPNMYQNPVLNAPLGPDGVPLQVAAEDVMEHYEDFYEDVFEELAKYGEVENLNVCDNVADHMVGNVYVKFRDEESAARCLQGLQGRYYAGRPVNAEFSPVTDFREATCRQYEENTCNRGGYCNFMHIKPIGKDLRRHLFGRYGRRRSRSRSPDRGRQQRGHSPRGRDFGGFRGGYGAGTAGAAAGVGAAMVTAAAAALTAGGRGAMAVAAAGAMEVVAAGAMEVVAAAAGTETTQRSGARALHLGIGIGLVEVEVEGLLQLVATHLLISMHHLLSTHTHPNSDSESRSSFTLADNSRSISDTLGERLCQGSCLLGCCCRACRCRAVTGFCEQFARCCLQGLLQGFPAWSFGFRRACTALQLLGRVSVRRPCMQACQLTFLTSHAQVQPCQIISLFMPLLIVSSTKTGPKHSAPRHVGSCVVAAGRS